MMNKKKLFSDQEKIRLYNKNKVINYLQKARKCTKQDIGKDLSLSIPTVTNNLNELLDQGIITELGQGKSSGGRRPTIYRFNPEGIVAQGIEITPHGIRSAIVNLDGELLEIMEDSKVSKSKNELFKNIFHYFEQGRSYVSAHNSGYAGIGISLPGVVDAKSGYLVTAPNLHLSAIDFTSIKKKIKTPLYVENEANAAALAEKIIYGNDNDSDLLYLSITEGVGAGIYLHNMLYRGRRNKAGEIGHITLVPSGRLCNCGQKGCLERYVSEAALLNEYNSLNKQELRNIEEFMKLVVASSPAAVQIWEQYLDHLALGIQNLLHMFDPATVIIGGRLAKYSNLVEKQLAKRIFSHAGLQTHSDVKIKCSELGSDGALLGAGMLSFSHLHS